MLITFARGKVGGKEDQIQNRLDETVLEIRAPFFTIFVLGHSLFPAREKGNLCAIWSYRLQINTSPCTGTPASETLALALAVLPNRARLFDTWAGPKDRLLACRSPYVLTNLADEHPQ